MKHCTKLPMSFDVSMLDGVDLKFHRTYLKPQKYNRGLEEKYTPVPTETFVLPDEVVRKYLQALPKAVLDIEVPHVFVLTMKACDAELPLLPAHVDFNRSCGINVYMEAGGETTHYYDWDADSKALTEVERFTAERGDSWLMDTSVPHSVTLVRNQARMMLTFSFVKAKYSDIKQALEVSSD